jgi:transmembrane sensor
MSLKMNEIDRQAAKWAAQSDDGSMSPAQIDALLAWIALDPRHRGAYVRALAIVAQAQRAGVNLPVSRTNSVVRFIARRRILLTGSIAAGLAAVVITAGIVWRNAPPDIYSTSIGEARIVSLADGSQLTLNTDSRVEVAYDETLRSIKLVRGEAQFDVAKNKTRPFTVAAGTLRIEAVGTSFTVKTVPNSPTEVLVREGVVRVDGTRNGSLTVKSGFRVLVRADGNVSRMALSQQEITRRLAWRRGFIYFDNQSLAFVAREFARYSNNHIIVDDTGIAGVTVSGLYRSNDPAGFAKAAAASLGLKVALREDGVHLYKDK